MIESAYLWLLGGLVLCSAMCVYRIAAGPGAADRVVAIDVLGTVLVGFVAILTVLTGREFLLNVAIVWALVSWVGTLALAKHLEGKALDE
jgi:multicomponent Na+:H+ antiporter subunit F